MANISSAFLQRALTLRHMRLLIAIEELRQVGRVAVALNISQPAVSKALAEIENGVGVALFERTPQGMLPTAHGACLLRYAHAMTNEIARAVDELTGIEQGIAATVAVGATFGAGTGYLLSAATLQARQRLPELTVTVTEGSREYLLRQLRTGEARPGGRHRRRQRRTARPRLHAALHRRAGDRLRHSPRAGGEAEADLGRHGDRGLGPAAADHARARRHRSALSTRRRCAAARAGGDAVARPHPRTAGARRLRWPCCRSIWPVASRWRGRSASWKSRRPDW